jgi:hypothetical protein
MYTDRLEDFINYITVNVNDLTLEQKLISYFRDRAVKNGMGPTSTEQQR